MAQSADKMRFTVFTPTYNRGYIIEKLYISLQKQDFTDFEWLVFDDCSTDNTAELFKKWTKEKNTFPIRYYLNEKNIGKNLTRNKAVAAAKGELFCTVDSDDYLKPEALTLLDRLEKSIPKEIKNEFAAVKHCRCYSNGELIGTPVKDNGLGYVDATFLEKKKYNLFGDKCGAFYTDIFKKYPFNEFDGEKFISEVTVFGAMANDGYKFRWGTEKICICEYLSDGLSHNFLKLLLKNPKGTMYRYNLEVIWAKGFFDKTKAIINYQRMAIHCKAKKFVKGYLLRSIIFSPLAFILFLQDRKRLKNKVDKII